MKTYPLVKPLYRYMLTAICLTLLILVWIYVLYFVNQETIAQQQQRLNDYQQRVATIPKVERDIDELDTHIKQVRLGIANQHEGLSIKNGQDALSYIFGHARDHKLACGTCTIDKEVDKGWYTKHYISLELKGQLVKVLAFLDELKNGHNMVQSKNISLVQSSGTVSAKTMLIVSVLK